MHKKAFFVALIVLAIFSSNSFGQFNDYGLKFGLHGSGLLPDTDFKNDNFQFSALGRGFVRIDLANLIDLELGAGYGILAGDDPYYSDYWETSIIPADLRLLISPFDSKNLNPYGYLGFGVFKWNVNDKPRYSIGQATEPKEDNGFDFYVPFGLGFEIKLTNTLLLDISGGYNYALTDDIEYFNNVDLPAGGYTDGFWNFGVGLEFSGQSGSSDSDSDGLTLDEENEIGTNPENSDSDNDGVLDGVEVKQYNTDPLSSDSDGDGLSDKDEIKIHATNPNATDSDNDELSDGDELNKYNSDPLRTDSDFDGLADNIEVLETKTDPNNNDTDGDSLKDGDEYKKYKTDPTKADTDGDEISDGDEIFKHNTNPSKVDTDGGSVNDNVEVNRGTNPLNPEDDVILDVESPIVLDGVTFATGSAELTPESEQMLLRVLNTLNAYPNMKVEIRGYTDDVGSASLNQKLSQRRANSVRYWVLNKGINPDRVVAVGYGEDNPIADNSTPEGRRLNRRIEFVKID